MDAAGEVRNVECVLRRKDGSMLVAIDNGRVVRDELGRVSGFVGTIADITERRDVAAGAICFEITETVASANLGARRGSAPPGTREPASRARELLCHGTGGQRSTSLSRARGAERGSERGVRCDFARASGTIRPRR